MSRIRGQVFFSESTGKTIERVLADEGIRILIFDDKTFLVLRAIYSYEDLDMGDEVELYHIENFANELGIQDLVEQWNIEHKIYKENEERALYKELKKKYEKYEK